MRRGRRPPEDTPLRRELLTAATEFEQAEQALDRCRARLHQLIVASVRSGVSMAQVARDTGYTREYVSALVGRAAAATEEPTRARGPRRDRAPGGE